MTQAVIVGDVGPTTSVAMGSKLKIKVKFETDDPIWRYGDDGTKPHDIFPSRRKMLRFVTGGDVVFSRHVRHPGTRANNWSKMLQKQYQDEVPHRLNVEIASSIGGH